MDGGCHGWYMLVESQVADGGIQGRLAGVEVIVAPLPGTILGLASKYDGTIWLDNNAAGHGWDSRERRAESGEPDAGSMDLLTVLAHELGHVIGREHSDGHDVMASTLGAGDRSSVISHQSSGVGDVWAAVGDFGNWHPASRILDPASHFRHSASSRHQTTGHHTTSITDTLFASRKDVAGVTGDNHLDESDDVDERNNSPDDGLDFWSLLGNWEL